MVSDMLVAFLYFYVSDRHIHIQDIQLGPYARVYVSMSLALHCMASLEQVQERVMKKEMVRLN